MRKNSVVSSPSRRTVEGLAGSLDGEPWVRSGPWSWSACWTTGAHAEGLSYRRQPTAAASCKAGCGPSTSVPAESSVSRASYPMQDACVPESRLRRRRASQPLATRSRAPALAPAPPPEVPSPSSTGPWTRLSSRCMRAHPAAGAACARPYPRLPSAHCVSISSPSPSSQGPAPSDQTGRRIEAYPHIHSSGNRPRIGMRDITP